MYNVINVILNMEIIVMTEFETDLINRLKNQPNPEQIFLLIIEIIYKHLEPSELRELPPLAYLQALYEEP